MAPDQSAVTTKDPQSKFQNKPCLRNQKGYHERGVFTRDQYIGESRGGQPEEAKSNTQSRRERNRKNH